MHALCWYTSKTTSCLSRKRCAWFRTQLAHLPARGSSVASFRAKHSPPDGSEGCAGQATQCLAGRKAMEAKFPVEGFTVAGVTFDGRQDIIRQLAPDQIVYLEREPWNQYDPMAVRVVDLRGRTLGYIPRRDGMNAKFSYEGSFGLVGSVGPVKDSSQYGARLYARPKLASLVLQPLPPSDTDAAGRADLGHVFGDRWPVLRAATLAAADYRCEVTGADEGLELTPQWRNNSQETAVQLTRLVVLSQPIAVAKARLEQAVAAAAQKDGPAAAVALQELLTTPDGLLFTEINGFSEHDTLQYFEFVRARLRQATDGRWRVEVLL